MRILLDESLPRKLKKYFETDHEVSTVRDKGWLGQKNSALLKLMAENDFQLFVTVDRNLAYQQNLQRLSLTIFVLRALITELKILHCLFLNY
jgi:predicted nuclease of predicted toxin-antitoxin system